MNRPPPRRSGVVKPRPLKWYHRLAGSLLYYLIRLLSATVRYQWEDRSGIFTSSTRVPVIFCIWHNRLALALEVQRVYLPSIKSQGRLAAMVSASKDGGILARVLQRYRVQPVRGSTSRRGPQALLELARWARRGYDLAITPDGPRGPRYRVQAGVIALAQVSGSPIVPVSYHLSRKISLRSWDKFQLPLPFARCHMVLGPALRIGRNLSTEEQAQARQQLENRLQTLASD